MWLSPFRLGRAFALTGAATPVFFRLRGAHNSHGGRLCPRSLSRPRPEPKVLPTVAVAP